MRFPHKNSKYTIRNWPKPTIQIYIIYICIVHLQYTPFNGNNETLSAKINLRAQRKRKKLNEIQTETKIGGKNKKNESKAKGQTFSIANTLISEKGCAGVRMCVCVCVSGCVLRVVQSGKLKPQPQHSSLSTCDRGYGSTVIYAKLYALTGS